MSLSVCAACGGHVWLGPTETNRCEKCGLHVMDPVPKDPRDEWYPGADGVGTVQDLWKFYLARGEAIVELQAKLNQIREIAGK